MNGKRAEINNISKHVVLCSSRLSVLSYFSFYCYSIASPRSAWHCMPALRALRAPQGVIQVGPKLAPKMHSRASCAILALRDASKASEMPHRSARDVPQTLQKDYPLGRADASQGLPFGARERAKRAERRHAVPSRPRRCDRIAMKRERRENRERGRDGHHLF